MSAIIRGAGSLSIKKGGYLMEGLELLMLDSVPNCYPSLCVLGNDCSFLKKSNTRAEEYDSDDGPEKRGT